MLGGDDEDEDLEALINSCNDQIDQRPEMQQGSSQEQGMPSGRAPRIRRDEMSQADLNMSRLLEQNNRLFEIITKQQEERKEESSKRKGREEINYSPEQPVLLLEESYYLEDDAHSKIDTKLRQRLRPINVSPDQYWEPGAFSQVERPILGASLYLDHIMAANINEATICKLHDRGAFTEVKNWLSRNSGVGREREKRFKVKEVTSDEFSMV